MDPNHHYGSGADRRSQRPHYYSVPSHHPQRVGYGVPYEREEEKVELEEFPPRRQSALDQCMNERSTRFQESYHGRQQPTRSFYDTAYDDVLARKQQEYALPAAPRPRAGRETMIELGPGNYARLRGATETWSCIENDFHIPVMCFACSLELCCIQDADYVLCPRCRVVSPIEQNDKHFSIAHVNQNDGGVGLGFTFEELFKWQSEIMRRREENRHDNRHSQPKPPPPPPQPPQGRGAYY